MGNTRYAVGFTDAGARQFVEWFERVAIDAEISKEDAQNYFDSNEYKNFETGENLNIEVGGYATKSGNPELFTITNEMVEFA